MKQTKKQSLRTFWALNHGMSSSLVVATNGKSIIICRSYSCWGAPVFYAEHVANVLWPSIAFRQWLGSEYPQITTTPKKEKGRYICCRLGYPICFFFSWIISSDPFVIVNVVTSNIGFDIVCICVIAFTISTLFSTIGTSIRE